jgi:putative transcriptional regulator
LRGDDLAASVIRVKRLLWLAWLALLAACSAGAQEVANGVFLVAQPTLTEPTFRRTVILITQRPDGGSLGVIINRPTKIALSEAFPKHEHIAALAQPLHFGGPVQPQALLFLVRSATPPPDAIAVLQDVYLTTDADWVDSALATQKILSATRAYAGYAGWAPRQLRSEMERQGWYILPADAASVFDSKPDELWIELAKRAVLRPTAN